MSQPENTLHTFQPTIQPHGAGRRLQQSSPPSSAPSGHGSAQPAGLLASSAASPASSANVTSAGRKNRLDRRAAGSRRASSGKVARGLLLALGGLVALIVLLEVAGWPFLRTPIERQMAAMMERPVSLGTDFSLRMLGSVRLRVDTLSIGPPDASRAPAVPEADPEAASRFVDVQGLRLHLPYRTLWGAWRGQALDSLVVTRLEVDRYDAHLVRDAERRANWTMPEPAQPRVEGGLLPQFRRLTLRSGHLVLNDAVTDVSMRATMATQEGSQEGSRAEAGGSGKDPASGLRVDGDGRYQGQPFEFSMRSAGMVPLVAEGTEPVGLTVTGKSGDASFQFDGQAVDIGALRGLSGRVRMAASSLAAVGDVIGVTLPTTAPFKLDGQLKKDDELWSLALERLQAGDSRLAGRFEFDQRPDIPVLTGRLGGERLVLSDLLPALGAVADDKKPGRTDDGRVLPQRAFDVPTLRAMNADVTFDIPAVHLGALFADPVSPLRARLVLDNGILRISEIDARTAGGSIKGEMQLDGREKVAVWSADMALRGVALERWLRPRVPVKLEGAAPEAAGAPYVTGQFSGDVKARGRGASVAGILGSMDGSMRAWIEQGRLSHLAVEAVGLDLAQALGVAVRGDNLLPLNCAVVQFTAKDGLLTPDVALFDTSDSTLLVSGGVSLADEALDLTLTVRPKDFSPISLRTPIQVQGTFSDPSVRPQAGPLAMKLLGAAALAVINPLAALLPLIEVGDDSLAGCQDALNTMRAGGRAPARRDPAAAPASPARTPNTTPEGR